MQQSELRSRVGLRLVVRLAILRVSQFLPVLHCLDELERPLEEWPRALERCACLLRHSLSGRKVITRHTRYDVLQVIGEAGDFAPDALPGAHDCAPGVIP